MAGIENFDFIALSNTHDTPPTYPREELKLRVGVAGKNSNRPRGHTSAPNPSRLVFARARGAENFPSRGLAIDTLEKQPKSFLQQNMLDKLKESALVTERNTEVRRFFICGDPRPAGSAPPFLPANFSLPPRRQGGSNYGYQSLSAG